MANISIAEKVAEGITPTVEGLGCYLWDVEYVKEGARKILRITIDSEEGIDIDTCEKVHRAIDPVIDELDPIEEQYYLEVSSPGIERTLRTPEHFEYALGMKIDVKLFTAINGQKQLTGTLDGLSTDNTSILICDMDIPLKKIAHANVHFDFGDLAEEDGSEEENN